MIPKRLSLSAARWVGRAQGAVAGLLDRLPLHAGPTLPDRRPDRRSIAMESMLLPNGRFVLVLSDVADAHESVTADYLDQLREQTGAAAVLVFNQPVVTYPPSDINPSDM